MFEIKICGIRRQDDVRAVAASAADAIGLNFFSESVRYVDPAAAETRAISDLAVSVGLRRIGVFVNESVAGILRTVDQVGLDGVQLHGDESPAIVGQLRGELSIPLLRAIKLPTSPLTIDAIDSRAMPWIELDCHLLLDADAGSRHGGSGKTLHWQSVRQWAARRPELGWTLAGGLTAMNVARALESSGACSVDTASGVEEPKGCKSAVRINQFAAAAREAMSRR